MEPALREGDRLLVRYGATPREGQVVVARFADGTLAVKRAAERRTTRTGEPGWWLLTFLLCPRRRTGRCERMTARVNPRSTGSATHHSR
jgi:hypothetical protein